MLFDVFAQTRRVSRCRKCGAVIEFAELVSTGHVMPFTGEIVPQRPVSMLHADSPHAVIAVDTTINPSHFTTCPYAKYFRKPRGR
jgi:hypothetical protein